FDCFAGAQFVTIASPDTVAQGSLTLEPGKYMYLCGIPDRNGHPHYQLGMLRFLSVSEPQDPRASLAHRRPGISLRPSVSRRGHWKRPVRREHHRVGSSAYPPWPTRRIRLFTGRCTRDPEPSQLAQSVCYRTAEHAGGGELLRAARWERSIPGDVRNRGAVGPWSPTRRTTGGLAGDGDGSLRASCRLSSGAKPRLAA